MAVLKALNPELISFSMIVKIWKKKDEVKFRKIMSLIQDFLSLNLNPIFTASLMMEGTNRSCQAAYLRLYSLLFYKNPMLERKAGVVGYQN